MNFKKQLKIKDMSSSRLSGIKARAARRDEEARKQQEEAERAENEKIESLKKADESLDDYLINVALPKIKPLYEEVFEVICDLYDNGFGDEVVTTMNTLENKYYIETDTSDSPLMGSMSYINYFMPLDEQDSKYKFGFGMWDDMAGEYEFDYVFVNGNKQYWMRNLGEDETAKFHEAFRFRTDDLVFMIEDYFIPYFEDFLAWVDAEFPNE